jgi:hypothetical protein
MKTSRTSWPAFKSNETLVCGDLAAALVANAGSCSSGSTRRLLAVLVGLSALDNCHGFDLPFRSVADSASQKRAATARRCDANNEEWRAPRAFDTRGVDSARRREVFSRTGWLLTGWTIATTLPEVSRAVVVESPTVVFVPGQALGLDAAKDRFYQAKLSLEYLVDHWDDVVSQGGGDNIRRYLGTVGTTSGLYGISRVLKELQELVEDPVDYQETVEEFETCLRAAETAAYSSNFVEYSAASTKPEKYYHDAFVDVTQMLKLLNAIAAQLGLS